MTKVVSIDGRQVFPRGEPIESLVDMLTDILQMAKDGKLRSFVGTGFTDEGLRLSVWHTADHSNVYEMLGSLAWLEHEYVHRNADELDDE